MQTYCQITRDRTFSKLKKYQNKIKINYFPINNESINVIDELFDIGVITATMQSTMVIVGAMAIIGKNIPKNPVSATPGNRKISIDPIDERALLLFKPRCITFAHICVRCLHTFFSLSGCLARFVAHGSLYQCDRWLRHDQQPVVL